MKRNQLPLQFGIAINYKNGKLVKLGAGQRGYYTVYEYRVKNNIKGSKHELREGEGEIKGIKVVYDPIYSNLFFSKLSIVGTSALAPLSSIPFSAASPVLPSTFCFLSAISSILRNLNDSLTAWSITIPLQKKNTFSFVINQILKKT